MKREILSILMAIVISFSLLAGCGENKEKSIAAGKAALEGYLDGLKTMDIEKMKANSNQGSDFSDLEESGLNSFLKSFYTNLQYTITESKYENGEVICLTDLKIPDIAKITEATRNKFDEESGQNDEWDNMSAEEIQQKQIEIFVNLLKDPKDLQSSKNVEFKMVKNNNNEWKVNLTQEVIDQIYGDLTE